MKRRNRQVQDLKGVQYRTIQGDEDAVRNDVYKLTAKNVVGMTTPTQISASDRRIAFQIGQVVSQIQALFTKNFNQLSQALSRGDVDEVDEKGNVIPAINPQEINALVNDTTKGLVDKLYPLWNNLVRYLNYINIYRMSKSDVDALYALVDTIIPLIDRFENLIDEANDRGIYVPWLKGLEDFRDKLEIKDFTPIQQKTYSKKELAVNLFDADAPERSLDEKTNSNMNLGSITEAKDMLKRNKLEGLSKAQLKKEYNVAVKNIQANEDKLRQIELGSASKHIKSRKDFYEGEVEKWTLRAEDLQYAIQNDITSASINKLERKLEKEVSSNNASQETQSEYSMSSSSSSVPSTIVLSQSELSRRLEPNWDALSKASSLETEIEIPDDVERKTTILTAQPQSSTSSRPSLAPQYSTESGMRGVRRGFRLGDEFEGQGRLTQQAQDIINLIPMANSREVERWYQRAIEERDKAQAQNRPDIVSNWNQVIHHLIATPAGSRLLQIYGEGKMRRNRREQTPSYMSIEPQYVNYL